MNTYRVIGAGETFECVGYDLDPSSFVATFTYRCGDHVFTERIDFRSVYNPSNLESIELQRALQLLHIVAGVSYYKPFIESVKEIVVHYYVPDEVLSFAHLVYEKGLGELLYKHSLSPRLPVVFKSKSQNSPNDQSIKHLTLSESTLLGLGGGKDSLVAAKLLQMIGKPPLTFGVNVPDVLSRQAEMLGTQHVEISRIVDVKKLSSLKPETNGLVLNGHVPISAILSCIGLVAALLTNVTDIVVAVERSANEPSVADYQGVSINHQWSKTSEYETSFAAVIANYVHPELRFYSLLRPLKELDIMRLYFALGLANDFKNSASSCNAALSFTKGRTSDQKLWDARCDKCCFIYLLMSGAGHNKYAQEIMGKDLFADKEHTHTFLSLLGLTDTKPFDCVGEIDEARESMDVAKQQVESAQQFMYPETITSPLWADDHSIPKSIAEPLQSAIETVLKHPERND